MARRQRKLGTSHAGRKRTPRPPGYSFSHRATHTEESRLPEATIPPASSSGAADPVTQVSGKPTNVAYDQTPVTSRIDGQAKRPVRAPKFIALSFDDLEYIHFTLVDDFAGSPDPVEPAGVRDPNLLHSAVGRLTTTYGGRAKYGTIEGLAASLFYGICQNHAFHNGNKRTAVVALLCYLDRNGLQLETSEEELYELVTSLASHQLCGRQGSPDQEVDYVAKWIRVRMRQTAKGELPLRFQEFRSILVSFGCTLEPPNKGFMMLRRQDGDRNLRRKLPYHGETKELDPGYIRQARKALHLDEDHGIDSEVFYGARLRPDEFIRRYRSLLRNLAHV